MPVTDDRLIAHQLLARLLGVPVRWLRDEIEAGRIPGVRAGSRTYLCDRRRVEEILLARARGERHAGQEGAPL